MARVLKHTVPLGHTFSTKVCALGYQLEFTYLGAAHAKNENRMTMATNRNRLRYGPLMGDGVQAGAPA